MKIQFIGTGSGKTTLKRFHSSILISSSDYNLLVDCGDGISRALLSNNIDPNSIDGILITHFHPDHYSGLAALLVQMKLTDRSERLEIFTHHSNIDYMHNFIYQSYIFIERLGFDLLQIPLADDRSLKIKSSFKILTRQNSHLDHYRSFDIKNTLGFSCSSILFEDESNTVFYTGDIGNKEDLYLFGTFKINIMISEISHVDIKDIFEAFKSQKIKKLYLTHISDDDEPVLKDLLALLDNEERKIINIAYDGLALHL